MSFLGKTSSKASDIVNQARQQRAHREAQRAAEATSQTENRAAAIIQTSYAAWSSRISALDTLRFEWDLRTATWATPQDLVLASFLLLSFYVPHLDTLRLSTLIKSITSQKISPFVVLLARSSTTRASLRTLTTLVKTSFERLCGPAILTPAKSSIIPPTSPASANDEGGLYLSGVELRWLLITLNATSWPSPLHPLLVIVYDSLKQNDLYKLLGSALQRRLTYIGSSCRHKTKDQLDEKCVKSTYLWMASAITISTYPLSLPALNNLLPTQLPFVKLFLETFWTIPMFVNLLDQQSATIIQQKVKYRRILHVLKSDTSIVAGLSGEDALCLLANLVEWKANQENISTDEDENLILVLVQILNHCKQFITSTSRKTTPGKSNVYHPVFGWYQTTQPKNLSAQQWERILESASYLWSRSFLTSLLSSIVAFAPTSNATSPKDTRKLVTKPPSSISSLSNGSSIQTRAELTRASAHLLAISSLYLSLSQALIPSRTAIMSSVGFTPGFVPDLLMKAAIQPNKELFHPVLHLFCELASRLYLTLDDEEVYERQTPFTLSETTAMASFLNQFCFTYLYSNPPPSDAGSSIDPAYIACRRLLSLLYDRSTRRSFTEIKDFWLVREVKKTSFIEEITNGDARALEILSRMPQTVPFKHRVEIFRALVQREKATVPSHPQVITVNRKRILEDGYRQLGKLLPSQLKQTIRIRFVNELGLPEAGIDQHGIFKEFLEELVKMAFDKDLNLFRVNRDGLAFPSSTAFVHEDHLRLFEFVGRVLGKGLFEGITLDIPLVSSIYAKLLGKSPSLEDLPSVDPELYKNLTFVKHYDGDVEDLSLTFTIDVDVFGKIETKSLKYGGCGMSVTNTNRYEYIYLMADAKLNHECKDEISAFVTGFQAVISRKWLSFYNPSELAKMMCGESVSLDINDLRANTVYEGGYFEQHRTIRMLWSLVGRLDPELQGKFLKFVTSCSRPPVGGFKHLSPPFTIRFVPATDADEVPGNANNIPAGTLLTQAIASMFGFSKDSGRLPTSSTCFNLLKLPAYTKKSTLEKKLLYAITSGSGFELS
ncbi:hypothetical protein SeLEV6574_g00330 [Synchytrium endobioticum]|uniref:HECT-type E3 ubiquitin transferase n=1 Tax=Synchytrium endobioticum TaxID=286115 RepID=A0A507DJC7_9FUNG|nr:hypothetical protein SeLEV6574_g00330 [Synchytrium endobioticum]